MRSLWILSLGVILLGSINASIIEVKVDTDKEAYLIGENILVNITAYNLSSGTITLGFSSSKQATYIMDGVFDYSSYVIYVLGTTEVQILANDSYTWTFDYDVEKFASIYPLEVGIHSIVGQVIGYSESSPVQFEIIPEPATLILIGVGGLLIRRKR